MQHSAFAEGKRGCLIVRPQAGLGNRLSGLLSAIVIAETLHARLEIVWPETDADCFGEFSALFDPVGVENIIFRPEEPGTEWIDARRISGEELRRAMAAGQTLRLVAYTVFGHELREGWKFFEALRDRLRRMQPSAAVRALIDSVPAATVGMHIRFSDHFPCHAFTPRWCYRSALNLLGQRFPGLPVFICSDTPEFVNELKYTTPVSVITSPAQQISPLFARGSLEGTQAALADLWLLARCSMILSAPLSSFATTAQNLGGGLAHCFSRVADPAKYRQTQTAWKIAEYICRDQARGTWIPVKLPGRNISYALAARSATAVASYVSSRSYQDRPLAITQRKFDERFQRFLDSPACQRVLSDANILVSN